MLGIILGAVLLPVILVAIALAANSQLPRLARYGWVFMLVFGVTQIVGGVVHLFQGPKAWLDWFGIGWGFLLGACFVWLSRRMRLPQNGPVA